MRGVERLRLLAAYTILALWVGGTILDAVTDTYTVPADLSRLALIVAGFLFTPTIIKAAVRRTGGDDTDADA